MPKEEQMAGPKDWGAEFGNPNPLKVEIGPGKGEFLIGLAREETLFNFVAFEIRRKRAVKIESKIAAAGIQNARIYLGDARALLRDLFAPGSVSAFFVHFPDPWPKRRHTPRRILEANFVELMRRTLIPDGKVYLTTDVAAYAEDIPRLFAKGFDALYAVDQSDSPYHRTIHEWKFKLQNRRIHYFAFAKNASQASEIAEERTTPDDENLRKTSCFKS